MYKRSFRFAGFFVFGLLAFVTFAATVVPFLSSKQWYVRVFDYPRLQTLAIAVVALGWYAVFYFKRGKCGVVFVAMFAVAIAVQGYNAWPYTPLGLKQVLQSDTPPDEPGTVRMFICNVLQTNTEYNRVLEKIDAYDPDIVITTESDLTWQRALQPIEGRYPHRVAVPQDNTYGMHLYSRLPLSNPDVRFLVEPDIPSIRTRVRLPSGEWITLYIVHPRPPVPTEADDSKERDAEIVLVAKEARRDSGGVIVAGDFNDVAWSATTELFQEVSGLLDPRRGRGFFNTFHARIPIFRWPLDHIFHSNHFKLVEIERVGPVNSDHFPMYVQLHYAPQEKHEQPEVKESANTEKKANETIRKGKQDPDAPGE